ncbi:MAG: PepSY-associated TM helix domain-containing protein [Alphaproteobacteria bacterium]|nr:PepSY-associated TM helix domain-containing protein [Alphaproteobacteria bacterium]MBU2378945.1 PepSY-associated TM helix domain-containing protein [Alphaproteobacteria bacterium]
MTDAATDPAAPPAARTRPVSGARAFWLKQLHRWHWISAGLSLAGMLLFAITGITLNHAAQIPAEPVTVQTTATLPAPLLARLSDIPETTTDPVPDAIARWASSELNAPVAGRPTETEADEIYVALPGPGADGWLTIDRTTGEAVHETTSRGWVAYLNDLHKGRDTGPVWYWFIDVFAVACVVFAITGLTLLWLHARNRASTWPLVGLGVAIPVIIALIFIH